MKFNCGPSPETKRKLKNAALEAEHRRFISWHPFFAIWPRRVGENDCRWLEQIERKGEYVQKGYAWEYRARQETK